MKKMLLVALCAAASAGFAADVLSENIVGFNKAGTVNGFSNQIACFENVGAAGMDIQSIIPYCADGVASGDFTIQFYDEFGGFVDEFSYVLGEDIDEGYEDGWYESDWLTLADYSFDVGTGFTMFCAVDGGTLIFAGEVNGVAVSIPVANGFTDAGNVRPVAVDIQDIVPACGDAEVASGDFTIQFYDEFGGFVDEFSYVLGEDIDEGYADGWYESDWLTLAVYEFDPGEGFKVFCAVDDGVLGFDAL